ncbi:MAG: N(4)-(beta-N-acetylglucosaminyl)-L-asparaginase [Planctomycetota bacterium]|nr:N(4)-(beta-N-acetylglucosaminyl)-L-asparaginase [Planctomycetota bacterium]
MAPTLIASWNGAPATKLAALLHSRGTPLLDAIVEGIKLVEDDPEELSVGYGGLPNEEGDVELDACVMDGPLHKAGAVAGLKRVRHAAAVAREVLRRTDHALLVGEGALKFARQCGFREEDLMTAKSREAWLAWKAELSPRDGWISPTEAASDFGHARWAGHADNPTPGGPPPGDSTTAPRAPFTYGTIHVSGLDASGNLYACTSTSGLSYKIPGRAGDSPIVGAGVYTDNAAGSAGATGRGESTLHNCAAYEVVRLMEQGRGPTEAALETLRRMAARTKEGRLLASPGRPNFNVTIYALRKDGQVGCASMHEGYEFITQSGDCCRVEKAASVFSK